MLTFIFSCESFVEIDTPNFQITTEAVFKDDETAIAAVKGLYNQLYHNNTGFSNGWENSITVLAGLSGGLISPRSTLHTKFSPYSQHEINTLNNPAASANLNLWSSAYNIIYLTNSVIKGLEGSTKISADIKNKLIGQALFIRAFTYFYLVNLYGDVPLLLTTDYRVNTIAFRTSTNEIWSQIEADLDQSISLLNNQTEYNEGQRIWVNKFVAMALQARVCLFLEKWSKAEELSSKVIENSSSYELLEDLNQVFLKNSKETIWQISPIKGSSIYPTNTNEATVFIIYPRFGRPFGSIELSNSLIAEFESFDKRKSDWIGQSNDILYYPYKYKVRNFYGDPTEYSMVIRFAEQFLIRAEARTYLNNLNGALVDLNKIRTRAGLDEFESESKEIILESIYKERKKELSSEWGHHWFDLKRTKRAQIIFKDNHTWEDTDLFYPIPEEERMKNPNLSQNLGY